MTCPTCNDEGVVERWATPEEVDAGHELGIAFDPCPNDAWHFARNEIVLPLPDPGWPW